MNAPTAFRSTADTLEAIAISDRTDALLVLWARAGERLALGTLVEDDVEAIMVLVRG